MDKSSSFNKVMVHGKSFLTTKTNFNKTLSDQKLGFIMILAWSHTVKSAF